MTTPKKRLKDQGIRRQGESSGRFAAHKHEEAEGALTPPPLQISPSDDQYHRARAQVTAKLTRDLGRPPTELELVDAQDFILSTAASIVRREEAYQYWAAGTPHPDDPLYEEIWAGDRPGLSQELVESKLAQARTDLENLEAGTVAPDDIFTTGLTSTSMERALELLAARIELYTTALKCHGRNIQINQAAVQRARG